MLFSNQTIDLESIGKHPVPPICAHIAKTGRPSITVTTMVVGINMVAGLVERPSHGVVATSMLAHTMGNVYHRPRRRHQPFITSYATAIAGVENELLHGL